MNYSRLSFTTLFICSMFTLSSMANQAEVPIEEVGGPIREISITIGGSLNDGNTDNESGNFTFDLKRQIDSIEYTLNAKGIITRTTSEEPIIEEDGTESVKEKKETTAKNGEVKGNFSKDLSDLVALYLNASAFSDEMSDIDYRLLTGPGFAFKLVKTEKISFVIELGISGIWEKQERVSDYYTAVRSAERFEYTFAEGAKIWQSCEFLHSVEDSDKYLINSEAGIESPLNEILSLQITATDRFNSMPSDDSEKNDLSITAGIRIKL